MIWAIVALLLGGIIKGATGAGAPVIAVPVIAMVYNVPLAIVIFTLPNLLSNIWQAWAYRAHALPRPFLWRLAGWGMVGVAVGTVILATVHVDLLQILLAGVIFLYIGFRIARPGWSLGREAAHRLSVPAGFAGGFLQGAAGISAPVSVTFLNAMRLERSEFIATVSIFFIAMCLPQIPLLMWFGLMDLERFLWSLAALIPIMAGMPIGTWMGKRMSRVVFDRVILVMLAVIGAKLVFDAVA